MTEWKPITSFYIPQEVWNKAEVQAKEWGWTTEAVLCDSLEKAFDYSEKKTEERRFKVYCNELDITPYTEVTNTREEDRDNDFVGAFSGICSKEVLLRIASEGYGISEDEIEFVDG